MGTPVTLVDGTGAPVTLTDPSGAYTPLGTMAAQDADDVAITGGEISGVTGLVKADVGLGNVNNTSDANKPISTATQTALDLKAPKDSPRFTTTVQIADSNAAETWDLFSPAPNEMSLYKGGYLWTTKLAGFDIQFGNLLIGGTKVVGAQGAAVADATDAGSAITQLNLVLARLRAHGLIAT